MPGRPSSRVVVGLLAGLLLTAGLPPFGWWPLALAGAGLLARTLGDGDARHRAIVGLATGLGFLAPGLWWMTEFTLPGWALAMLLEAGIFTLAMVAVPRRAVPMLGLPAALVLADALRGRWPFGGVPIATVAQTQIGGPLLDAARLGGGLLVTALVGLAGVGLAAAWRWRLLRAGIAVTTVLAVTVGGLLAPDGRPVGPVRVALVQGGGERGTRAVDTSEEAVFEAHLEASKDVPDGVDLILWPEDVVDVERDVVDTAEGQALATLARRNRATLVVGVVEGGKDHFVNLAQAWGPDGRPLDSYEKNQRVPFGEYIPLRSLVERVADVSAVPRDAEVGSGPGLLSTEVGRLGVVISYEVFFARRARDAVHSDAEMLLVPTNASSYTTTQMPALELGAARMRAVETGRDVLQAAPTGFSAMVDHRGRVVRQTDLGDRAVLTATADRRHGDTPYTSLGDGPFVVGAALVLALAWRRQASRNRRRRRH